MTLWNFDDESVNQLLHMSHTVDRKEGQWKCGRRRYSNAIDRLSLNWSKMKLPDQ